jgi:apolipoprotein N-acyltransferase
VGTSSQIDSAAPPERVPASGSASVLARSGAGELVTFVAALALSVLSPLCLVWALPPTGAWPLVFVALVPMLVAQHRLLRPELAGLAPAITVGLLVVLLSADALRPVPPELYGLALFLALVEVGIGRLDRQLQVASGYRWFVIAAPLVIVGADVAQGSSALASTWAYPAYALFAHRAFVAPVSVFTTDGLDLLILATNYALAQFLIRRVSLRSAACWTLGVALVWLGWLLYGQVLASHHPTGRRVTVAAVQVPPGLSGQTSSALSRLTGQAAADGARLVVWHEEAVVSLPAVGGLPTGPAPPSLASAQRVAKANRVYLVTGVVGAAGNEAVAITPSGQILGSYGKQHPVTFLGDRSVPTPVPVYPTSVGPLATIICYDLDFVDTANQAGARGAAIVAVPSQDWGRIAPLHYTHLVFRAVENNLTMVKADGGFDSAIIDPDGRILTHTSTSHPSTTLLVRTVRLGTGNTTAQALQPWVAPGALAIGLLLYTIMLVRGRRDPRPRS